MTIIFSDEQDDPLEPRPFITLAEHVLREEGYDPSTEAGLMFVSPPAMAALNEQHMGRSGPTDVLAFPIEDATPGTAPPHHGAGPPSTSATWWFVPRWCVPGRLRPAPAWTISWRCW